jgi:hypothetical protein
MKCLRGLAAIGLLAAVGAICQKVTDEANVRIDDRIHYVRKINGRWWFYHHRPVNLSKAETMDLFMQPDEVRTILGNPDQANEKLGFWWYHAENGTAVFVRFLSGERGEARYERSDYGVHGRPVKSIEEEFDGRSIFAIRAKRAGQRSSTASFAGAKRQTGIVRLSRASSSTVRQETVRLIPREPPARRITGELLDGIKPGMTRDEVVRKLDEPDGDVTIHFENGKVARIIRSGAESSAFWRKIDLQQFAAGDEPAKHGGRCAAYALL